jgi:acetate kinase
VYEQWGSYANRDKYIGVATIQYLTVDTVYISGVLGILTAAIRTLVFKKLRALGVKHVHYERNGIQQQVEL